MHRVEDKQVKVKAVYKDCTIINAVNTFQNSEIQGIFSTQF